MVFKINIAEKGKTYKLESESSVFVGKKIGDSVSGKDIDSKIEDYDFKITGASSKEGFPLIAGVEGVGLRKVLLKKGKGMKIKKPKGLKIRKTVHSNNITKEISQINLVVIKKGAKPLDEVFGKAKEENKKMAEEEKEEEAKEEAKEEAPAEEKAKEETSEETAEEEKKEE